MTRQLKNPFLLTAYFGRDYFCDRDEELHILENHFENERNVVLYAWRRMGKTALIQCFLAELEAKNKAETIYVDLLGTRNLEDAILQITKAVYFRFGKTGTGISGTLLKLIGAVGLDISFDAQTGMPVLSLGLKQSNSNTGQSLEALGSFLQSRKKTVLIALDEFQRIKHYENQNGEAVFRAWMQQFPDIRFIFSGSHRHMMQSMFTEKNRPFYQSAQLLHLKPIKYEIYEAFIMQHFSAHHKKITSDTIKVIYSWSRQQTYVIQLLCNRLFGMYNNVEYKHLQEVCDDILKEDSVVFSNYTNLLTLTQWRVLQAVAKDEPLKTPLAVDFIKKYSLGAGSSVSRALSKLIDSELVIKDESDYLVHEVLLSRWLQSL